MNKQYFSSSTVDLINKAFNAEVKIEKAKQEGKTPVQAAAEAMYNAGLRANMLTQSNLSKCASENRTAVAEWWDVVYSLKFTKAQVAIFNSDIKAKDRTPQQEKDFKTVSNTRNTYFNRAVKWLTAHEESLQGDAEKPAKTMEEQIAKALEDARKLLAKVQKLSEREDFAGCKMVEFNRGMVQAINSFSTL